MHSGCSVRRGWGQAVERQGLWELAGSPGVAWVPERRTPGARRVPGGPPCLPMSLAHPQEPTWSMCVLTPA